MAAKKADLKVLPDGADSSRAAVFASMILHDAGQPITPASISAVIKAAGLKFQLTATSNLFATFFGREAIGPLLVKKGDAPAAGGSSSAAAAPAAGGNDAPKAAAKPAEEEEEAAPAFDLF
eukprot:TRINITY_DN2504_c0_g1_i1.p5 TRINITY_DN2504_c0_g1~~TRINITY_DN2504_c0_g1_i1.p5  ORF type:complete len:121 (-),score=33.85 TRINITY_DN2504_c0_g1_i1:1814-2176(-)